MSTVNTSEVSLEDQRRWTLKLIQRMSKHALDVLKKSGAEYNTVQVQSRLGDALALFLYDVGAVDKDWLP